MSKCETKHEDLNNLYIDICLLSFYTSTVQGDIFQKLRQQYILLLLFQRFQYVCDVEFIHFFDGEFVI